MATVSLRIGTGPNAGQVIQAFSESDVLNGIQAGDDVLVNGANATVGNSGGNWYLNGVLVCMYFGTCPQPGATTSSTSTSSTSSSSSSSSSSSNGSGTTQPGASGGMALSPVLIIGAIILLWAVD